MGKVKQAPNLVDFQKKLAEGNRNKHERTVVAEAVLVEAMRKIREGYSIQRVAEALGFPYRNSLIDRIGQLAIRKCTCLVNKK